MDAQFPGIRHTANNHGLVRQRGGEHSVMGIIDIATRPLREGAGTAFKLGGWAFQQVRGGSQEQDGEQRSGQGGEQQQQQSPRPTRQSSRRPKQLDDITIARKVETELFRLPGVEKGKIDVNVVDGVVYLRGIAKTPAQVRAVEAKTRAIPEVVEVENLLHLPKTPAPTRARRTKAAPATPRRTGGRVNADTTVKTAGDTPADLASRRQGRVATEARSQRESAGAPADGASRFEHPDRAPETNGAPSPDAG